MAQPVQAEARPPVSASPGVGALLLAAFHVYGAGAGTLIAIAAAAFFPLAALNITVAVLTDVQGKVASWLNVIHNTYAPGRTAFDLHWELLQPALGAIAVELAVSLGGVAVLGSLAYSALIKASQDLIENEHARIGGAYRTALGRFLPLLLSQVLLWGGLTVGSFGLAMGLAPVTHGFVLVVLPLLFLVAIRFAVAGPAVVIDGLGPLTALKESWRITSGRFWKVFWFLLLLGLLSGTLSAVISSPASMASGSYLAPEMSGLFQALASTLVTPLGAAGTTLLYFTLQGRHLGLAAATRGESRWVPAYAAFKVGVDGSTHLNGRQVAAEDLVPVLAALAARGAQIPIFLERPDQPPGSAQARALEEIRSAGVRTYPGDQAPGQWGQLRAVVVEVAPRRFRFGIEKASAFADEDLRELVAAELSFSQETQLLKAVGYLVTSNRVVEAGEKGRDRAFSPEALAEPAVHLKLDFGPGKVFCACFPQSEVPGEVWSFCYGLRALAAGWTPPPSARG